MPPAPDDAPGDADEGERRPAAEGDTGGGELALAIWAMVARELAGTIGGAPAGATTTLGDDAVFVVLMTP